MKKVVLFLLTVAFTSTLYAQGENEYDKVPRCNLDTWYEVAETMPYVKDTSVAEDTKSNDPDQAENQELALDLEQGSNPRSPETKTISYEEFREEMVTYAQDISCTLNSPPPQR